MNDFLSKVIISIVIFIAILFGGTMIYINVKSLWSKAETEIQQKDLLEAQVEYDRRQAEAMEEIAFILKEFKKEIYDPTSGII